MKKAVTNKIAQMDDLDERAGGGTSATVRGWNNGKKVLQAFRIGQLLAEGFRVCLDAAALSLETICNQYMLSVLPSS